MKTSNKIKYSLSLLVLIFLNACTEDQMCKTAAATATAVMVDAEIRYTKDPTPANCEAYKKTWFDAYNSIKSCGGDTGPMDAVMLAMQAMDCQ